jgi:HK97 gp10 family phage protein
MTVTTVGIDRILAGLDGAIERGVVRGAGFIADLAAQLAPEKTGALKASIRVEDGDSPTSRKVIAGDDGVDYAAFVEFGTSNPNYPAQPYMIPAREAIDVTAEVAVEVKKLVSG